MKKSIRVATLLLALLVALSLCVAFSVSDDNSAMAANEIDVSLYLDENGHYQTKKSCGNDGAVLGTFNGAAACVHHLTGELHMCCENFPDEGLLNHMKLILCGYASLQQESNVFATLDAALGKESISTSSGTIYSFKGVEYLTNLESIWIWGLDCRHIELSRNTKLVSFSAADNYFTEIDFSNNPLLKEINLHRGSNSNEALTSIDVSNLTELETLDLNQQSKITNIDLSNNTKLKMLDLRGCPIKSLDVTSCPELVELSMEYALIEELDVTNCPKLEVLYMYGSENITELDVTKCPLLEELNVQECSLKALELSCCPELKRLIAGGNSILNLDISKNQKLKVGSSSYFVASPQHYDGLDVLDCKVDLSKLPGFDLSKVRTNMSSGNEYNFLVYKSSNSMSNETFFLTEPILPVNKTYFDTFQYIYRIANYDASKTYDISVTVSLGDRKNTVNFVGEGVDVFAYEWSTGVGEKITSAVVGDSCTFDVFPAEGYEIGPDGIKVEYVVGNDTNRKTASEVTGKEGDLYWLASYITAPTTIYISGVVAEGSGGNQGGDVEGGGNQGGDDQENQPAGCGTVGVDGGFGGPMMLIAALACALVIVKRRRAI